MNHLECSVLLPVLWLNFSQWLTILTYNKERVLKYSIYSTFESISKKAEEISTQYLGWVHLTDHEEAYPSMGSCYLQLDK